MKRFFVVTLFILILNDRSSLSANETTINDNPLVKESVELYTTRCDVCGHISKSNCEYTNWNINNEYLCIHGYAWGKDIDMQRMKKDNIYCAYCRKTTKKESMQEKTECHGYNR